MGIMIVNEFEIRSYGWQELAVLYGPDLMPESAGKRLSKWVGADPVRSLTPGKSPPTKCWLRRKCTIFR